MEEEERTAAAEAVEAREPGVFRLGGGRGDTEGEQPRPNTHTHTHDRRWTDTPQIDTRERRMWTFAHTHRAGFGVWVER